MKNKRSRAAALVVVLSVVVLLSLIVVSLAIAMRMERQAAHYFSERARAEFFVKEAVEMEKMILNDTFSNTNNYVISMSGRLMVTTNGTSWTNVDLASGPVASDNQAIPKKYWPPDLNRANKTGDNLRQINPLGDEMRLPWIWVYKDGQRRCFTNSEPEIDKNNPIIGRYAFWADDESTRINLNTAWKGNSIYTQSHPSQISLSALSDEVVSSVDDIHASATNRPFLGIGELSRISANLSSNLSTNRFFATTYNQAANLNPWGEPKIYLTTQLSNLPPDIAKLPARPVGTTDNLGAYRSDYFLDILPTNNVDPGSYDGVSDFNYQRLGPQISRIADLLSRTNWPYYPGKSFAQKYYGGDSTKATQLALDIIEYVRSVESTNECVSSSRVLTNTLLHGSQGLNVICGTSRHPVITELGAWFSPVATNRLSQIYIEVYLPPNYGLTSYTLVGDRMTIGVVDNPDTKTYSITSDMVSRPTLTAANPYAVITGPVIPVVSTNSSISPRFRVLLFQGKNGDLYEVAPNTGSLTIGTNAIQSTNAAGSVRTVEVDDPRNNKNHVNPGYWKSPGTNTLGAQNTTWQVPNAAANPPQDRESGSITDDSLYMPPPRGQPGNLAGKVSSVAELGRIASGVNSFTTTGVGWRTLRMQPTSGSAEIPDWALFDIFAAPATPALDSQQQYAGLIFPNTNFTAGQINLNTSVYPFTNIVRTKQVQALMSQLNGVSSLSNNVISRMRSTNSQFPSLPSFYRSAGELVEIAGICDSGNESSELRLRQLVDLATVRSSAYRIFAVGQSIKQTPTGDLIINATKSVETVLDTPTQGAATRFRSVSWQEKPF